MTEKTNLDVVKLEKRICGLEHTLQSLDAYIVCAEASLRALEKLVEQSNKTTDAEIDILLRAIVRLRELAPKQLTKKHLIMALLEDEYCVKLHFPKKAAGRPVPPR